MNYFAYGSNLHPMRLEERLGRVRLRGIASLGGADLRFNKIGLDGSGKANLLIDGPDDALVYGVVYQINNGQKEELNRLESLGCGYNIEKLIVEIAGAKVEAFTYIADQEYVREGLLPFGWYKRLVLAGARYYGFPQNYISMIENVDSLPDGNQKRLSQMEALLTKIQNSGNH